MKQVTMKEINMDMRQKRLLHIFSDGSADYINRESTFEAPKTTRVYLHPPMAQRMFSLFCDGKFIFGDVPLAITWDYFNLVSEGIVFLGGENLAEADFKTAKYTVREDGIPIHTLENSYGSLTAKIEAFSNNGVNPTLFSKITLINNTSAAVNERFGFMLRSAQEWMLVKGAPDIYVSYQNNIDEWRNELASTYEEESDGVYTFGEHRLHVKGAQFNFCEDTGIAKTQIELLPGEELSFTFSFDNGEYEDYDYGAEKQKCIAFWEHELARMNKLPSEITNDPNAFKAVRHLVAQMLQCFCRVRGTDYVFCRQGGLQRQIWLAEAKFVMETLGNIGSFDDYIEPVLSLYFDKCQEPSGEVTTLGIPWANSTSQAIASASCYALSKNSKEVYGKYREKLWKAFCWMEETRAKSEDTDMTVSGLFPPMASCDAQYVFQAWKMTDATNLIGLEPYVSAAEKFDDPNKEEIRRAYENYFAVMKAHYERIRDAHEESAEFHIPLAPIGDETHIIDNFAFDSTADFMPDALKLTTPEIDKLVAYYKNNGGYYNGLCGKMPQRSVNSRSFDPDGIIRVWYTVQYEYNLISAYLRNGEKEKARVFYDAIMKYCLNGEYHVAERMHERDPYYAPWMPNASFNARIVNLIITFCK